MAGLDSKHLIPSNDQLESRSRSSPLKKDHVFGICSHLFQCFRLVNFMQHIVYIYKIYQDITIHLYPQGGPVQVFFFYYCVPTQTFATLLFGRLMECKSMMIILQHQDCCRCSTYPSNKGLSSGSTKARVH